MPKQGQSVESCIVTEFKKKPGDKVEIGDVLFSYETDKASFEEEAKVAGTVLAVFFREQDEIPVLTNVMVIGNPGESFSEFAPSGAAGAPAPVADAPAPTADAPASAADTPAPAAEAPAAAGPLVPGAPVSPRARRLASEKGIDPRLLAGSGPGGRIIERDVIAAGGAPLTGLARAVASGGGFQAPAWGSGLAGMVKASDLRACGASVPGESEECTVEKMSNMRKLISRSMFNSLRNSAQLTHMLGADARKIQALRKKAKKAFEAGRLDANITINDFVCYAVIKVLQQFSKVNSHCLGDALKLFRPVHLGLAVDTERGLMVPACRNAERLDIAGLSRSLKKLADDCKKGAVNPDLLSSEAASFTVSNLGGYGVEWFTPIINVPQSAILGVGTIVPRPGDLGGGVYAFVPFLQLSLTYDHRAIDGGEATRFLKAVADEIGSLEVEF